MDADRLRVVAVLNAEVRRRFVVLVAIGTLALVGLFMTTGVLRE